MPRHHAYIIPLEELSEHLDGVAGATSIGLLALHAMNVGIKQPSGEVLWGGAFVDGLMNPAYWKDKWSRERPDYLFRYAYRISQEPQDRQQLYEVAAEQRLYLGMVAECHELTKRVAIAQGGVAHADWATAAWARFAWVVRDAVKHDGVIQEQGYKFPIEWKGLAFETRHVGTLLATEAVVSMDSAFALVDEMIAWATKHAASATA
jgi:hypothetical protein